MRRLALGNEGKSLFSSTRQSILRSVSVLPAFAPPLARRRIAYGDYITVT